MENMGENLIRDESSPNVCISCGTYLMDHSQKAPLCVNCRKAYIKFPIPKWVKIFGAGILAVLLFSLVGISGNISTGIHFARAKAAINRKAYVTAQKELLKVVAKEPQFTEAFSYLLISAYHNSDYKTFQQAYENVATRKIDNEALYTDMVTALDNMTHAIQSDSFKVFAKAYGHPADSIPPVAFAGYIQSHENDVYAKTMLAKIYMDEDNYAATDSMANILLNENPDYYYPLYLKITVKREMLQMDSSDYYIRTLLSRNTEDVYARAAQVRNLLKVKQDKPALILAKKLYADHSDDAYVTTSLIMAYHFNGDIKNRDMYLAIAMKDTANPDTYSFVNDIISGKEIFRK
jgi:hypothetical protein